MNHVTLYSKPNCHLCDLAYTMLAELGLETSVIDIQANPKLMEKYHLQIPVVIFNDQTQLCWPFDTTVIQSRLDKAETSKGLCQNA